MNVLILGGSGFLGTAVAQACERSGATVRVLSRTGRTTAGEGVRGDVRLPRLGLSAADLARVRAETTHVVFCFGSVSWTSGPGEVLETHSSGTRSALAFLRELPELRQAVHVSSLLALGRSEGRVTNRELYTGQRFRNWYEYGKYCAERLVRDTPDLPVGVVRFGPVLGPDPRGGRPDTRHGLPMAFPHLLAGYPVHLARRGDFPCWITDVSSAAEIVLTALDTPIGRATWTWFDPALPTLGEVFTEVSPALGRRTEDRGGRAARPVHPPDRRTRGHPARTGRLRRTLARPGRRRPEGHTRTLAGARPRLPGRDRRGPASRHTDPTGRHGEEGPHMTGRPASVDTDPHPYFTVYSAGNFGEVAPQRLSPMSWSLVGDPMERGTRALARRLWGRPAWAEGGHYVFVGYFGCRPYHNLAAYCHLSASIPGLRPSDVTDAYFEGVDSPAELTALRSGRTRQWAGSARLLREMRDAGPRLRALEERVAELEWGLRAATTANSPIALAGVLRDAQPVLEEAWAVHILTTSGLVPVRALQRRVYGRLLRHGEEIAHWLTRPRELVWDRLHTAASTLDPYGPGDFLSSSFYEVADGLTPWQDYAVRHKQVASGGAEAAVAPIDPAEALTGMVSPWRGRTVRALAVAVGEMMAYREHSKSLAMRTLHIYRRLLPALAASFGEDAERLWPYLTLREFTELATSPGRIERARPRVDACRAALATPMPEHLDLSAA